MKPKKLKAGKKTSKKPSRTSVAVVLQDLFDEKQVLEDKLNDALERNAILHEEMSQMKASLEAALSSLVHNPGELRLRYAVMREALLKLYDMADRLGYEDMLALIDGGLGRTPIEVTIPSSPED
jgi:hypothetical protein